MAIRSVPPEQMTARARRYLAYQAARHGIIGGAMLMVPSAFNQPGFDSLRTIFPLWLWGVVMVVGAVWLTTAAISGAESQAQAALVLSVGISAMWAVGWALVMSRGFATIVGVTIFTVLALTDLNNVRNPLSAPFEPIIAMYNDRHDRDDEGRSPGQGD
jgi:hypothetical protein